MEKTSLLKLEKLDTYWRMNGQAFQLFITHLCRYYMIEDGLKELARQDVLYAEINDKDMAVASWFFALKTPDKNTLVLSPIEPILIIGRRRIPLTLHVCAETEGIQGMQEVHLR